MKQLRRCHHITAKYIVPTVGLCGVVAAAAAARLNLEQTFAPQEQSGDLAPAAIVWSPPAVPKGPIEFESAEQRKVRLVVITRDLEQPWSIAFLPDGAMLVTERPGRLRVVRDGRLDPHLVEGVPPVATGGLQGLMDVVLHPHFAQNKWVYLAYHKPIGDDESQVGATTLARGTWDGTRLVDVRDIFESGTIGTEASRIVFDSRGMLYMTISGPGNGPQVGRAQDPNDYAGKVVRLRDDGSTPSDDPFVGRRGHKPAIYTTGHRNGGGLTVNPETGEVWETEQGPSGGDELNVLHRAGNYGWPIVSYGRDYWGNPFSKRPTRDGIEDPLVVWLPSIGVTGMTFYTGERFPNWKRNLFVAGLREGGIPRTGQIQRIVFNDHWQELRREPLLTDLHQRIRDIRQGPDGLLYVVTAEKQGALLRLEPADEQRLTHP
jgi:glucose/arabinose dehydrogenase